MPPSLKQYKLACIVLCLFITSTSIAQPAAKFSANITSGCSPLIVQFQDLSTGNPTKWKWDLGNGTISQLQNPTATYFTSGTYNVKLIVENADGIDSVTKNQYLIVFANPSVQFTASDTAGCFPKTVQFTDNSLPGSGNIVEWTWDFGDGNISNEKDPVHTYTKAGNYHVTLKVVNSFGCQKVYTRHNYIQLDNISADFTFIADQQCISSANVNFIPSITTAKSYKWFFGDGTVSTAVNPSHVYTIAGTYNVKLLVENNGGCIDSVMKTVTIQRPAANFNFQNVCIGSAIQFQNTSLPTAVNSQWFFGDGTSSNDKDPFKIYTAPGSYQVKLISDFGECKDTVIKTVMVYPKSSASFTETGDVFKCSAPAVVNFNTSNTGSTYQWFFGDGNMSNQKNPTHTYTAAGNYTVTLITTNAEGCSDTVVKQNLVKIVPPKVISINNGIPYAGCVPYTTNFSAQVDSEDPVVSWSWDFGDGSTSTVATPSHTYSAEGSYDVEVIITTASGCTDSFTFSAAVILNDKPVADFIADPLVVCAAQQVQFTNQSTGANQWLWLFGDGGYSTEKNPVHQYSDTGFFTVTLIAFNNGCTDTIVKANYIRNEPPIARYNIVQNCIDPFTIEFKDNSIGAESYKWIFGDGDSSNLKDPVHTYNSPGVYHFTFTVSNGNCSYTTNGVVRIVDEYPEYTASDSIICKNSPITFTATNINLNNIVSYQWDFGDGNIIQTTNSVVIHQYSTSGTYLPKLVTTNISGCTDTATTPKQITVYGPTAAFTNIDGACINTTVQFNDTSSTDGNHPITEWFWNFGDGVERNLVAPFSNQYSTAGTFDVQLKVKDSYGCWDAILKTAAVIITDPVAAFVSSDSIKCSDNEVVFNNSSSGLDLRYTWNFGEGNTASTTNGTHSYTKEGIYAITLSVIDRFGCIDIAERQQVISNPKATFNISDTFSSCPPLLVNVNNTSSSYTNISWNFGDGSSADLQSPSHYYTTPGIYQLQLKVNGFGDCVDSAYKTIHIKGPTGTFSFSPSTICINGEVSFQANSNDSHKFLWDFSDGATKLTTSSTASHVYDVPGFYQPKLILIDTAGCEVPIISPDTLKVMGVKANMAFTKELFCDSASIQFLDSSVVHNDHPSQYQWSFGDGNFSALANPAHNYQTTGAYTVRLKVTSDAGCIDSVTAEHPIVIHQSPEISINSLASVCVSDSIQFSGVIHKQDTSALSWNWTLPGNRSSFQQNLTEKFTNDGDQMMRLIALSNNGCADTATKTILVHPLPNVTAGTDTMICRGQLYALQPSGAASFEWQADATLIRKSDSSVVANPLFNTTYYVKGISQFGCTATDSVIINVLQPFTIKVNESDTLCEGSSVQLIANGAAKYNWFPSTGLNNTSVANPVAQPTSTTDYMVIGSDHLNCFTDTAHVKLSVFPIPQFNIIDNIIIAPAGSTTTIRTNSSADITKWKWYPAKDLNCADCPQPVLTAKDDVIYKAQVWNDGGCTTSDQVTVSVVCDNGNVFIPNTFSPNSDGMNDVFYPRGKGVSAIKSMKVFNRWGDMVFEKNEFTANDVNAGWNGTFKGSQLTPDVYVYIVDVVCDNSSIFTLKGNVTLIR